MIRLKFYPPYIGDNPYIELFYRALEPHGVVAVDDLNPYDRTLLARLAPEIQVVHIQWCPERIWRGDGRGPVRSWRSLVGFARYLRRARSLGIRVLWTIHDFEHHDGDRLIDRFGYRLLARSADLCICHDVATRRAVIRRFGARPGRTVVMPIGGYDGVYPEPRSRGETLASLDIARDRRVLVCFGRVRPYKGVDVALDALASLGEPYHLIVVGAPLEAAYGRELAARAAGLSAVSLLLEEVSDQRLADLLHAADCVLLPYRRITGSSALLAALTLGRGVVASDLPFFRETLAEEPEAGVLCAPTDPIDLARAVRTFFELPADRRHAAARRIADRYAWDRVIAPVADWFDREFPGQARSVAAEERPGS